MTEIDVYPSDDVPSAASDLFQVSLSAYQIWQRCEQRYYYQYVRYLRHRDVFLAPTLGRFLHTYLEYFYQGVKEGHYPEDAHMAAQFKTSSKFVSELKGYAQTAFISGNEDMARELEALPAMAGRLSDRYYLVRGKVDADRYEILHVEEKLKLQITDGIVSTGVTDLVTRDKENGLTNIWEHKSTQYVPQDSVRLRDFQTMLYAIKVRDQFDINIDSVIWNYIRTKEPTIPEVLKSGGLTLRKDLDSTWEVYSATARRAGIDPYEEKYAEMRQRLEGREETIFFPRYEVVIVTNEGILMDDYIEEARRMKAGRESWKRGDSKPIRTLARDCDGCDYLRICQAALTGGDEEDIISMRFTNERR
jgi:hypothetical protein